MDEAPHQGKDIGVIAQEIEKVLPEIVSERDTGYKRSKLPEVDSITYRSSERIKRGDRRTQRK